MMTDRSHLSNYSKQWLNIILNKKTPVKSKLVTKMMWTEENISV